MTTAPPVAELPFLAMLGALLLLGGAVSALAARRRPFTMLGLMCLSDIGLTLLGLGLGGAAGLVGGTTQLIYQMAARCLALLTLARLARTAGSGSLDDLRGIRAALPLTGLFFGFAMFAGMGLSVFLVPDGRAFILHAAFAAGHWGYAVAVAFAGMALAAATVLSVQAICLESGPWRESAHVPHAPSATFHVLAGLFAAFLAAFGLAGHAVTAQVADVLGVAADALPAFGAHWHPAALLPFAGAFAVWCIGLVSGRARALAGVALVAASLALTWTDTTIDPLSRLFGVIIAGIGLVVAVYSVGYIHHDRRAGGYWFFLLLMCGSLSGLALARDFGGFYVFWELMTFSSYFLVAHEATDKAFHAAVKYFVMCVAGACAMLPGFMLLSAQAGTLDFAALAGLAATLPAPVVKGAVVLAFVGFAVKAGLVPGHGWLPDAHPAAPSSISGPLSGILTKTGVYGTLRLMLAVFGSAVLLKAGESAGGFSSMGLLVTVMGTATMLYGELMALKQDDLKRLLAYSTMGQVGEIFMVIGIGTWLATTGSLLHVLNHAIMKNLLFLCAGGLILRAGSKKLADLAGMARVMPFTAGCMVVGLISIMGLPPFNGFVGKYLMLQSLVAAGQPALAAVLLLGSLAGCVYYMRIVRTLVFQPYTGPMVHEAPASMRVATGVLAALCLVLGVLPQLGLSLVTPVADMLAGAGKLDVQALPMLAVTWHPFVLIPMLGAVVPFLLRRDRKAAGLATAIILAVAAIAVVAFGRGLDSLSFAFALVVPVIGCLNMFYAVGYMEHSHTQWRFYTFFLFMVGGLMGVAASNDLFGFFTFWEIMSSWSLYFVIVHEENPAALREGFKYFFFNVLGAAFLFLGVVMLSSLAGDPSFGAVRSALPTMPVALAATAVALMAIGFTMKAAQLPFRIDVQMHPATAPTPVSGYISSVLLKSALFGLAKLFFVLGGAGFFTGLAAQWGQPQVMYAIAWVGGITIVMAALLAVMQSDLKLVLIYSTVSQLGYMVVGVALGTPLGMAGGMLHLVNHVLFKDLLFLVAGSLILCTHKHSLDELGGIGQRMPVTLTMFAIGALSVVGVPPTNGFASKWILYHALMAEGEVALALLSLAGSVLTLAYFAKFLHSAFLGRPTPELAHVQEAPRIMLVPMGILAAGCIITGVLPGLPLLAIDAVGRELGFAGLAVAPWGVASGAGAFNATALAVLLAVAFFGGRTALRGLIGTVRTTDIHPCGVAMKADEARLAPQDIYGAPLALLRQLAQAAVPALKRR